jgi:cell division cycle 20, cofactor of APC complex
LQISFIKTLSIKMSNSVNDFENLGRTFSDTMGSGLQPRWERKKQRGENDRRHPLSNSNGSDRFIPNRAQMNMDVSRHNLSGCDMDTEEISQDTDTYKSALSSALLGDGNSRILSFGDKAPEPKGDIVNNLNVLYSNSMGAADRKKSTNGKAVNRHISSAPARILDAPDMLDDYYLNLLSWSDTNILAVALDKTVYLWDASTGNIIELCTVEGDINAHIASVSWVQEGGAHIAVGTSSGRTQLWDVHECKMLRSMDGHTDRISSLSWNEHLLSSGGRDSVIVNHDVRIARHNVATLRSHSQEVCQLAWSHDGKTLASGSNDNKLCLWDVTTSSSASPRFELTDHQAAVKALAWSPHERHLLASGGGTADRTMKFWNTQTGALLNSIDTGSQVCALQWNPFEKEILSSHGFARNHLCLWKYPSIVKIKELEGHSSRVLHMAISPDGGTVVSAAADETLRFWEVFAPTGKNKSSHKGNSSMTSASDVPFSSDFLRPLQIR